MPLYDAAGRVITRTDVARARAAALAPGDAAGAAPAYEGARTGGTFLSEWPALLRSADRDWLPARNTATARVRDVIRNNPIGATGLTRKKNAVVGRGWRVKFRPNARALGISLEAARELGAQLDTEFLLYGSGHAFESDAERTRTFGQNLRLALGHLVGGDGEALGLGEWAGDEEETRYKTRLRIVDPDRLCNPMGRMDSEILRGGIERNPAQVPVRYHIRERHPADYGLKGAFRWKAFDRFTAWGRPQVFHCFESERAGQTRGVSRFVSALKAFRSLSKFTDATLEAATINALIVGFLKSNSGPEAAGENFEVSDIKSFEGWRQEYYDENPISLAGGAKMPVLPYGDEIELKTASRDVGSFDAFFRSISRLIAAALGVTAEELIMDYSQTNYSSARAAMIPAWADTVATAGLLEDQLVRPFCVAWAEEAFDRGYVQIPAGAPDFYDAVDAYVTIHCIGPGRGYVDPTKEIDAAAARIEAGVSTLEDECADQGKDWDEVLQQRAREKAREEELGLSPVPVASSGNPADEVAADQARDARPAAGALSRVRAVARSSAHEAFLDRRGDAA